MANLKISDYVDVDTLDGTELFLVSKSGVYRKTTLEEIRNLAADITNTELSELVGKAANAHDIKNILNSINTRFLNNTGYGIISGGVVSAQSTPNMTVNVNNIVVDMPNGANFSLSGNSSLSVSSANSTNPRIDIVYVSSSGSITYLSGIPASSPSAPSLPSGAFLLAEIYVGASVSSILNSNITDKRKIKNTTDNLKANLDLANAQLSDNVSLTDINYLKNLFKNKQDIGVLNSAYTNLKNIAYTYLDGSINVANNGTQLFTPDGTNEYKHFWVRDFAYMLNGCLEHFSELQILNCFKYIADKVDTTNWYVADHINADGTVYWTPGNSNDWGSRACLDGNFFLVDIMYSYYKKTKDTTLYNQYKTLLKNIVELGVPYNSTNGLVSLPQNAFIATYGFWDTVNMTGDLFFLSVLAYQAYSQLAILAYENGDISDSTSYLAKAKKLKKNINDFNFTGTNVTDQTLNNAYLNGLHGFYNASTGKCSGQQDVWGSALAVYLDIPSEEKQIAISKSLTYNYLIDTTNNIFYKGGVRHVPKGSDFIANTQVWETYIQTAGLVYGHYQSGAYWATPIPWVAKAINLTNKAVASQVLLDLLNNHLFVDANSGYEWIAIDGTKGVAKYCSSCALPLLNSFLDDIKIIQSGSSTSDGTTMYFRKYNDGTLEIYGNLPDQLGITADKDIIFSYPVIFANIPSTTATGCPSVSWTGFSVQAIAPSSMGKTNIEMRIKIGTPQDVTNITFYAIGRWN